MKLLLVGVLVNPKNAGLHEGVSSATNKWQFDFVHSLEHNNCEIKTISYISEPAWPKGKLFPKLSPADKENIFSLSSFTYINLPYVREFFIYLNMKMAVRSASRKYQFDFLVTFNTLKRNTLIGRFVQDRLKKKWISIIGDGAITKEPDVVIIQNYYSFINYPFKNKYLYEGGVPPFKDLAIQPGEKNLVFTGTITELTGIEKFAETFSRINPPGFTLDIYGRGDFTRLQSIAAQNRSIRIFGYVSYPELVQAMETAYAFINPRNEEAESDLNTFPSKILEYIPYGKPMISTDTKSFKPEFKELLYTYSSDDIESLKNALARVKHLSEEDLLQIKTTNRKFIENYSWNAISKKFCQYLKELV